LTIALSDFTVLIWLVLMMKAMPWAALQACATLSVVMPVGSICYAALMLVFGRSTLRDNMNIEPKAD
jgi:hypothetical protein